MANKTTPENASENAPESNMDNAPEQQANRKTKKQGPIRWEAIAPFSIVVALIWAYFFFFFDTHLRHGIEYIGTQANGAEVNVGRLKTSFWNASLEMDKIQITDLEKPTHNKVQVGKVRWKMLWDALLRGKVAIEDASILEVAIGAPRARPGRVLPPPPPNSKSAFEKLTDQAISQAEKEFSNNVLGDIATIIGGTDPAAQLKNIEGQLKSSALVKNLEVELKNKEQEWKQRLERLPQNKDLEAIQTRIKKVKVDGFSNPTEVQQSVQELDSIYKEIDAKYKEVQSTGQALNGDVNTYQKTLSELEATIRQDIKDLEARLQIPKLDVQSLTQSLFGGMFLNRVKQAQFYMNKAREYMPPKKTAEEKAEFKAPKPREREKGRNYKFGRPNAYPLFWLKKAQISSKATEGADWSGDLTGTLQDVTDDPPVLGRPTIASFEGEFPKQNLSGVSGKLTIDHVTEIPVESLALKVGGFPLNGQQLVHSEDVKLGFESAHGSSSLDIQLRAGELAIKTSSVFQNIDYLVDAKQPILADILKGAVKDIPKVTLDAGVTGSWSSLRFNFDSNLGRELAGAFGRQIQAKINEARAKLENLVNEQVGKERAKLEAEFKKAQAQVQAAIKSKEEEVNKFKNQIEQAKNEAINSQKKKLENEGKKAIDELKNKFKF